MKKIFIFIDLSLHILNQTSVKASFGENSFI